MHAFNKYVWAVCPAPILMTWTRQMWSLILTHIRVKGVLWWKSLDRTRAKRRPKGKGGWSGNVFQKEWLWECTLGFPLYFLFDLGKHILYTSAGFLLSRLFSSYEVSGTALNMSCVFSQFFFPKWYAISFNIILFVMSWIGSPPPKFPYWSPYPQYLWRWLYLEIEPLKRNLS